MQISLHQNFTRIFFAALMLCAGMFIPSAKVSAQQACEAGFTYGTSAGSLTIYFTNTSSNTPNSNSQSYYWSFGDGKFAQDKNTSHTYANNGKYTVCLYMTAYFNTTIVCQDTICKEITVGGAGNPCQSSYIVTGGGLTKKFTSTTNSVISKYNWIFGDGATSDAISPNHTYTHAGKYRTCLYITTTDGCQSGQCDTLEVTSPCTLNADFESTHIDNVFTFTSKDITTLGVAHKWIFGDGETSDGANPTHNYPWLHIAHTYTVCHIVTLPNTNCTDTVCKVISVDASNPCAQNANYQYTINNNVGQFMPNNSGSGITHKWIFGDGTSSASGDPSHTFPVKNTSATYTVCHITNELINSVICRDTVCKEITIGPYVIPAQCDSLNANFEFTINGGIVKFTSADNPTGTSHYWSFGDNTSSGDGSPSHTFAQHSTSTTYNVCHIVHQQVLGGVCIDTVCKPVVVPATNAPECSAKFEWGTGPNVGQVNFTDLSTTPDSIIFWSWTFGDGGTSGDKNPHHSYTHSGRYKVCLTIKTNKICYSTKCDSISVTVNTGSSCDSLNAEFVKTGSGNVWAFSSVKNPNGSFSYWSFGDGTNSSGTSATHTYPNNSAAKTYVVCHYVGLANTNCKIDTTCKEITVPGTVPCNSLSANYEYGHTGNVFHFEPVQFPPGTQHKWTFGDGTSSSDPSPYHTYTPNPDNKTYHVCHIVNLSSVACTDTICKDIVVPGSGNHSPCDSLNANFEKQGSGNVWTFSSVKNPAGAFSYWTFGDNTSASGATTTHTFPAATTTKTYQVCHYIGYTNANCIDTVCKEVSVPGTTNNDCKAKFTFTPTNAGVYFADASTGTPYKWQWSFGDGTYSDNKTPVHKYAATGRYVVCLTITTVYNCISTFCDTISITVSNPCSALDAEFQVNNTGNVFKFTPIPVVTLGVAHKWVFGDGTTSDNGDPYHTYPQHNVAFTYTVCHIVSLPNSNCSDTVCKNIVVPASNTTTCAAKFLWTVSPNGTVAFTNLSTSTDVITKWKWTFGDGSSSDTKSPSHTYNGFGRYRVCLNITTANGCTSEYCDSVKVGNPNPCTGINANFEFQQSGNTFSFYGVQNQTTLLSYWVFGDGTSSSDLNPKHTYPNTTTPKVYNVCHILYLPGTVCVDTVCKEVKVNATTPAPCKAKFTWNVVASSGNYVVFTNLSSPAANTTKWAWTFGDGGTSDAFSPNHQYNNNGKYRVCLKITTADGCVSEYCDSVKVNAANTCRAEFKWAFVGCDTVKFTNTSADDFNHVNWIFGDGTTSDNTNPVHKFPAGTWTVILTVFNNNSNCESKIYHVITVQPCNTLNDTICGVVFNDLNSNGVLDGNETPLPNTEVHIDNNVVHSDSFGHYIKIVPAGLHKVYIVVPSGCIPTIPIGYTGSSNQYYSYYEIKGYHGGTFCGFDFGINCNVDHICGKVYFDANNNGVQDSTEKGLPNIPILILGPNNKERHAYTNASGEYCETVPDGAYVVKVGDNPYRNCTATPASINVTAAGGTTFTGNDFAIYCLPAAGDLAIEVTPNCNITPGYPAWYNITVCNKGNSPMAGVATLYYDAVLAFNYALPPQSSSTGNSLSWNITNLAPGHCVYFWAAFNANAPLPMNQQVFTIATVTPATGYNDVNADNNIDTLHQEVKSSWDPNEKIAYQTNYSDPSYQLISSLNANQRIEYTISFQNEGNAEAINIIVNDELSADVDASSFEFLGSSHPCVVTRNGSVVDFKFSNIMLPYTLADEPGSHGYVKYAVNAVNGLPAGHVIADPAAIYFDYNDPVWTGNADVVMLSTTGIYDVNPMASIVIAPNPMSEFTQVTLKDASTAGFTFRVIDITGRVVAQQVTATNTIMFNRDRLTAGVYIFNVVKNDVVVGKGKLVIE